MDSSRSVRDQEFVDFIGKNADKYLPKFRKFAAGGHPISWNWAASLLSFWWFCYRKLYLLMFLLFISNIVVSSFFSNAPLLLFFGYELVFFFFFGMFSDYFYYRHTVRRIGRLKATVRDSGMPEALSYAIKKTGGVNRGTYLIAATFSLFAIVGISFALLLPQFTRRDFTESEKIREQKNARRVSSVETPWTKDTTTPASLNRLGLTDLRKAAYKGPVFGYNLCVEGDCLNGFGCRIFSNGDRYLGEFENGLKHGHGIYFWPSGSSHEGNWKTDMRHGRGIYRYASGKEVNGIWDNGKFTSCPSINRVFWAVKG